MDFNEKASAQPDPDGDRFHDRLQNRAKKLLEVCMYAASGMPDEIMRVSAIKFLDTDWNTLEPGVPMDDVKDRYIAAISDAQVAIYEACVHYLQAFEQRRHVVRNGLVQGSTNTALGRQELVVLEKAKEAYIKMAGRAAVAVNMLGQQQVDMDVSERIVEQEEVLELEEMPKAMLRSFADLYKASVATMTALCDAAEVEAAYLSTLAVNGEQRSVQSNRADNDFASVKGKELATLAKQIELISVAVMAHKLTFDNVKNKIIEFGRKNHLGGDQPDHGPILDGP